MYNQVNHVPQTPMPPAYQQSSQALPPPPRPPPHFLQGLPAPPIQLAPTAVSPHFGMPGQYIYLHGPPNTSSTVPRHPSVQVPPIMMQNTGQSFISPPPLLFSNGGQNWQHSLNLGSHIHHGPPPVPPPVGQSHHETRAPVPPATVLPPPPPPPSSLQGQTLYKPPFHPCPPQPGDGQSLQHIQQPPLPPSTSNLLSSTPDGVYQHSACGNCLPPSSTPPPLPSSLLPLPFPAPPPVPSTDHIQDSGSKKEIATADSESLILDLPSPPSRPTEEETVLKIESLCQLIAENGPEIEDKTSQDENQNPKYAFLFGGDPGTEAAISHEYFLWMKKKYILENRCHNENSKSQLRPLAVDSYGKHAHQNIATECNLAADSDMEMEDDITLSDKDQGLNHTIGGLTQQQHQADKEFILNEETNWLQNSTENNPVNDNLSSAMSCFGSFRVSKQDEGSGLLSDFKQMESARSISKVCSPVNSLIEVAEFPLDTGLEKSAAPPADDFPGHVASGPAGTMNPDSDSCQHIRSGTPIRLLQDYASDDTSDNEGETCFVDAGVLTMSQGAATSALVAYKNTGSYLVTDIGSKSPTQTLKHFEMPSKMSQKDSEISPELEEAKDSVAKSVSSGTNNGCVEHNTDNQASANFPASSDAFQGKDGLSGDAIDHASKNANAEQEDEKKASKLESNPLKVDEFGRLARESSPGSDSDESRYRQTRRYKRDRSPSRSQSPVGRRRERRRRRPWRRKDKRGRSRSWSPRNRRSRSRSRSPVFRRSGDFRSDNVRRDKGQCFNFLRGNCYRGVSCRYIHHEFDKNASSRLHRNKGDLEVSSLSKNSRIHEGGKNIFVEVSDSDCEGIGSQEMQICQNVSGSPTGLEVDQRKEDCVRNVIELDHNGQSVIDPIKSVSSRQVAPEVRETLVALDRPSSTINDSESFQKSVDSHQQLLVDGFPPKTKSSDDARNTSDGSQRENNSSVQQFKSNVSVGGLEDSDSPCELMNLSDLLPDKQSTTSVSKFSSEPSIYMLPSTQLLSATKELPAYGSSVVDLPLHSYQLPLPPALSHSQGETAMHMPQMSGDYGIIQQNWLLPYQSTARDNLQSYPALLHSQNSQFSVLPNSSWTSLPPPPPPLPRAVYSSSLNAGVATYNVSLEFNQRQRHSRVDFVSHTSVRPELSHHSQGSAYHNQAYAPIQEHERFQMHTETFTSQPLHQGGPASQLFAGPDLGREGYFKWLSMRDSKFSSLSSFGNLHPQPKNFSWESATKALQTSSGGKLPPEEHLETSAHIHPFLQKQQPIYSFQYSGPDSKMDVPRETVTSSRYPPDALDSNPSAPLPDFGGSRISAHYNSYASAYVQPISSKLGSSSFRQEKDVNHVNDFDISSSLNHTSAGQIPPRPSGDRHGPVFDNIEPSSTSLKKLDLDQKMDITGEFNISLRPKSSSKCLDVEESNKDGQVGVVASTTSLSNDEYGETADAEVGAVENESSSNPVDVADMMTTGEKEIDQIKSPGKRKKSKDSRSMRLFKISIANFVKEVLKPSWRQGNMSKVAFKTIVKKTVDKVSGAMKGHRVPKSQVKINQYIDSSRRKLTKLVMGYVDKYVKV